MEKYIFDESNGLWYELQGDYYIPCLTFSESENYSIGIWGQRHERWLKENCKVRYFNLITSGKLNSYLHNIDLLASETESRLINEFAKQQGITEELKAEDMMAWVGAMNNPYFQRKDEGEYLNEQNILMQAWSPLAAGQDDLLNNPVLVAIAKAHQKSSAQVILRWLVQRNILPLVKSSSVSRMKENLDIFDFSLTQSEMEEIAKLDKGHTCFMPRNTGKAVTNFLSQCVTGIAPSGIIEK